MSKGWKSGGLTFAQSPSPQTSSLYPSEFHTSKGLADLLRSRNCSVPQEDQLSCRSLASSLGSAYFPFGSEDNRQTPKEETIKFILEDGSSCSLVVGENLRVSHVCHLLALKLNRPKLCSWSVREYVADTGIERILEDDEDLLKVYDSWGPNPAASRNKFKFRQDIYKYDFFQNPSHFIPLSMVDLKHHLDCPTEPSEAAKQRALQEIIKSCDTGLVVQSYLWCKEPKKQSWKKVFFRLEGDILYAAPSETAEMTPVVDIHRYNIYYANEKRILSDATAYSFCLKPLKTANGDGGEMSWLCCESEVQRQCWVIALRLAKYGNKLLDNYKEVRARYGISSSTAIPFTTTSRQLCDKQRRNSSFDSISLDSTASCARTDFSKSCARSVPETKDSFVHADAISWRRKIAHSKGTSSPPSASPGHSEEYEPHLDHPWFYSDMSREEANKALTKYGTVNGVFLVRDSKLNPGCIVLSYVYNKKVHHVRIMEVEEQHLQYYSLDNGVTKFFDLVQLVEFYQLNKGCLPVTLAHYLVLPCNEKQDRHA